MSQPVPITRNQETSRTATCESPTERSPAEPNPRSSEDFYITDRANRVPSVPSFSTLSIKPQHLSSTMFPRAPHRPIPQFIPGHRTVCMALFLPRPNTHVLFTKPISGVSGSSVFTGSSPSTPRSIIINFLQVVHYRRPAYLHSKSSSRQFEMRFSLGVWTSRIGIRSSHPHVRWPKCPILATRSNRSCSFRPVNSTFYGVPLT